MRRRPIIAAAMMATAAVAIPLGAAPGAPAALSTVNAESVSSSEGFVGCVRQATPLRRWAGCIVAYRLPDGQVAVRVLAPGDGVLGTQLNGTYGEEAVLPASTLSVGGDLGFPVVRVSIPAGALARTGAVSVRATAAYEPGPTGWSLRCLGPIPGPLHYAFASQSANRSLSPADATGTWEGVPVMMDADDPCYGIYGTLFAEPVTGTWAWADPRDDSLLAAPPT